jgi:putative hemolysin
MALVWARKTRLTQKADAGATGARAALDLVDVPPRFLSTVQRSMPLVGVVASTFGAAPLSTTLATQVRQVPPLARPAAWPERAVACRWDKRVL